MPENWSDAGNWRYVGPAAAGIVPSPIPGPRANVLISTGSVVIVDAQFNSSRIVCSDELNWHRTITTLPVEINTFARGPGIGLGTIPAASAGPT